MPARTLRAAVELEVRVLIIGSCAFHTSIDRAHALTCSLFSNNQTSGVRADGKPVNRARDRSSSSSVPLRSPKKNRTSSALHHRTASPVIHSDTTTTNLVPKIFRSSSSSKYSHCWWTSSFHNQTTISIETQSASKHSGSYSASVVGLQALERHPVLEARVLVDNHPEERSYIGPSYIPVSYSLIAPSSSCPLR